MKIELSTARQLRNRGILDNMFDRPDDLVELVKIGSRLHRYYEHICNGYNYEKYERLSEKLENRAVELAEEMGIFIYIQTDPRGATIYIDSEPIPDNNYTRAVCLI